MEGRRRAHERMCKGVAATLILNRRTFAMSKVSMSPYVQDHINTVKNSVMNLARGKGTRCPCCDQFVKIYRRQISSTMARQLMHVAKNYAFEDFQIGVVKDHGPPSGVSDFSKLSYWGLIEPVKKSVLDKGKTSGKWRITNDGRLFANKMSSVQQYAMLYNGKVIDRDGPMVDIVQCLGEHFDYDEIMKPAYS